MNTNDTSLNDSLLQSKQVLEMITVANDFTAFIDKAEEYSAQQVLVYLHRVFPLIYLKASLLPILEVTDDEAVEHYVTEEEWEKVFLSMRNLMGMEDEYVFIDLDEPTHQDPVKASLSENVADLYQDLKDFLLLYQKPLYTFKENAVKECRELFENRYGFLLVNGLTAIHYRLYGNRFMKKK